MAASPKEALLALAGLPVELLGAVLGEALPKAFASAVELPVVVRCPLAQ